VGLKDKHWVSGNTLYIAKDFNFFKQFNIKNILIKLF